jgi:vanillate O-demethylase ferredoxin subunit
LTTEAPDAVYVCGPQPFIDLAENRSDAFGLPKGQLVKELFSAAPPQIETSDASFAIELAGSGLRLDVPCTMSILEVLRQNGITVPTSCEQGVCGTCLTKVRHGTPDHRDLYLSDDERANGDLIALCVSRAKSAKLVLDI